jgi:prepilin-type N-terminal cleavage/methylation domain-containing protein
MRQRGFTLIELVLVMVLVALLFSLVGVQNGSFTFWREEGFIRKFQEQLRFIYTQSVSDQATYQLEIDLAKNSYRIGVVKEESSNDPILAQLQENLGNLSLELSAFLNPPISEDATIIPSPSFPSLYEEMHVPTGMKFIRVKTPSGNVAAEGGQAGKDGSKAYLYFTPNGSSDFGVITMQQSGGAPVTFVINPFTSLVDIYRDGRDVSWESIVDAPANSQN